MPPPRPPISIRLTPPVAGMITDMPLNYANIADQKITNKVLVQSTRAVRRDNGLLEARGRLVNCTNHTLQIEARATFYDASDLETEAPTAWQRFSLSRHAVQSVAVVSLDQRAARYLLEIREGR